MTAAKFDANIRALRGTVMSLPVTNPTTESDFYVGLPSGANVQPVGVLAQDVVEPGYPLTSELWLDPSTSNPINGTAPPSPFVSQGRAWGLITSCVVGHGMAHGWDQAAKSYYGHNNVDELERAWLQHLRDTRSGQPSPILAANPQAPANANVIGTTSGKTVRLTVPPAQPFEAQPIVRGAMPDTQVPRIGATQWQPAVRLETPVPLTTEIPRLPAPAVLLGMPRP